MACEKYSTKPCEGLNTISPLSLKFTWPEFQASDEVQVEEFWLAMESEALEQAVFPSNVSITRLDASIIAPFFPALMRSSRVVNTEKDKLTTNTEHAGGPDQIIYYSDQFIYSETS